MKILNIKNINYSKYKNCAKTVYHKAAITKRGRVKTSEETNYMDDVQLMYADPRNAVNIGNKIWLNAFLHLRGGTCWTMHASSCVGKRLQRLMA